MTSDGKMPVPLAENFVFPELDSETGGKITGSRFYRRGVRAKGSALVQPAAMMRGLAAALPINVTLYEESPVIELGIAQYDLAADPGEIRVRSANEVRGKATGL